MLSVDVAFGGDNVLTDCGTYLYNGPKEWRDYFKGTGSHNTVCVDRQDQMINHRRFKWLKRTDAKIHKWVDDKDYSFAVGSHFGYNRLSDKVTHSRAVFLKKGRYIVITDYLNGEEVHDIGVTYNIACKDYEINDESMISIIGLESNLKMVNCYYKDFKLKTQFGEEDPIGCIKRIWSKGAMLEDFVYFRKLQLPACIGNVIYDSRNNNYKVKRDAQEVKVNGEYCGAV